MDYKYSGFGEDFNPFNGDKTDTTTTNEQELDMVIKLVSKYTTESRYEEAITLLDNYLSKPEYHDGIFEAVYFETATIVAFYYIENNIIDKGITLLEKEIALHYDWYSEIYDIVVLVEKLFDELLYKNITIALKIKDTIETIFYKYNEHILLDYNISYYYITNSMCSESFKYFSYFKDKCNEHDICINIEDYINESKSQLANNKCKLVEYYKMLKDAIWCLIGDKMPNKTLAINLTVELGSYYEKNNQYKEAIELYKEVLIYVNSDKIVDKMFYATQKI